MQCLSVASEKKASPRCPLLYNNERNEAKQAEYREGAKVSFYDAPLACARRSRKSQAVNATTQVSPFKPRCALSFAGDHQSEIFESLKIATKIHVIVMLAATLRCTMRPQDDDTFGL